MNEYEYWHCHGCGCIIYFPVAYCVSCLAVRADQKAKEELESKAEIWDEGYDAACRDAVAKEPTHNPYR